MEKKMEGGKMELFILKGRFSHLSPSCFLTFFLQWKTKVDVK